MAIRESRLGRTEFIADGGFGEVFRVNDFTLPGDATKLAYKRFTSNHGEQAASAARAVAYRAGLTSADRSELDDYSVWPRDLVEDAAGQVCGLLMPLIPADFFCQLASDTGQLTTRPCEMSWLIATDALRQKARMTLRPADSTERLILLARLVYAIGRLHKHGWVFGDLSFKNVMFALDPPRVMLVDCDGAAALADAGRTQASTPFWEPPESAVHALQDAETDCYKLGLAILRCLTPGKGASTSRNPTRITSELDAAGRTLIQRAVSPDRAARPTARELYRYLKARVASRITPPVIHYARLVPAFCVRGQDARIEWSIDGATRITIAAGSGPARSVDPRDYPDRLPLAPNTSGPVVLEAHNKFGRIRADLGELTLYELPPVNVAIGPLPPLQMPAQAAFSPAPWPATAPARPLVEIGRRDLPRLTLPSTLSLVQGLSPTGRGPLIGPGLGTAISDAGAELSAFIRESAGEFGPGLRESFAARAQAPPPPGP
jgi:serine/threonine protein kinase